jgi:hypothetical protein
MNDHTKYLRKYIRKIKVPFKIKIFIRFLHRKVLLTKDNLAKKNWNTTCCFCHKQKSVQHHFIDCPLAKIVCQIVRMNFSITAPINITDLFEIGLRVLQFFFI